MLVAFRSWLLQSKVSFFKGLQGYPIENEEAEALGIVFV
jgi:hypothetical protein